MLGKEFSDILQTTMGRTSPSFGQTTVPVVGQGVQEEWLTQLDGGRAGGRAGGGGGAEAWAS